MGAQAGGEEHRGLGGMGRYMILFPLLPPCSDRLRMQGLHVGLCTAYLQRALFTRTSVSTVTPTPASCGSSGPSLWVEERGVHGP